MASVTLMNVTSDRSRKLEHMSRTLHGRTDMNFRVLACPAGGSFDIVVETDYTDDENEVKDMLLMVLSDEVCK